MRLICSYKLLREEIMKRLEAPEKYKDRSLILWFCQVPSRCIKGIVEDCCKLFNERETGKSVWYHSNMDYVYQTENNGDSFFESDYTNLTASCNEEDSLSHGCHHGGIILIRTHNVKNTTQKRTDFINTHSNSKGHIADGWVIIACQNAEGIERPDDFNKNSDHLFVIEDLEIWARETEERYGELGKLLIDYVYADEDPDKMAAKWLLVHQRYGKPDSRSKLAALEILTANESPDKYPWCRMYFQGKLEMEGIRYMSK